MERTATWDPEQYGRFKAERRQPFTDLVCLVEPRPGMRTIDLGCGTGELTRDLHRALGAAETLGVDRSEAMLRGSAAFAGDGVTFEQGDVEVLEPDRTFDLVFSNAALHWVPDHESLFRRLRGFLAPGGQLALQMPANESHSSHSIAAEVARELGGEARVSPLLRIEEYAELLHALGVERQHVRMQVYGHQLPSAADVVEWVRGSLLTDYEARLGPERFARFLEIYRERIIQSLPPTRPYFYTYRRVLIWGALN